MGAEAGYHYSRGRLQEMGAAFCAALLDYCDPDPSRMQVGDCIPSVYPPRGVYLDPSRTQVGFSPKSGYPPARVVAGAGADAVMRVLEPMWPLADPLADPLPTPS
eukprot:235312-Prorocentrum_minimum.AAC.1